MAAADPNEKRAPHAGYRAAAPLDVETLIDRWVQRLERFPEQDKERLPLTPARPSRHRGETHARRRLPSRGIGAPLVPRAIGSCTADPSGCADPARRPPGSGSSLQVPTRCAPRSITWLLVGGGLRCGERPPGSSVELGRLAPERASLAQAIAAFRRRSPDRFEATLALRGIDAAGGEPHASRSGPPRHDAAGSTAEHATAWTRGWWERWCSRREPAARAGADRGGLSSAPSVLRFPCRSARGKARPGHSATCCQNLGTCAIALQAMLVGGTRRSACCASLVACRRRSGNRGVPAHLERLGAAISPRRAADSRRSGAGHCLNWIRGSMDAWRSGREEWRAGADRGNGPRAGWRNRHRRSLPVRHRRGHRRSLAHE